VESITLRAEPLSVRRARYFVRSLLVDRHTEPPVAELLTSELVTNVVRHAESDFTVMVGFEACVRVEVHDALAATNAFREIVDHPPEAAVDSPGGRGLPLVRQLSSRFGLDVEPGVWNGKIVWFEIDPKDLEFA
jgi:anti-sigma regulatory factor (Ser/Thr protein kinase)